MAACQRHESVRNFSVAVCQLPESEHRYCELVAGGGELVFRSAVAVHRPLESVHRRRGLVAGCAELVFPRAAAVRKRAKWVLKLDVLVFQFDELKPNARKPLVNMTAPRAVSDGGRSEFYQKGGEETSPTVDE